MPLISVNRAKKTKVIFLIGLFITALFAVLMKLGFYPLEILEDKMYDLRFKLMGKTKAPDNIVIAAIDEKSIEKLGRWPWGRDRMAGLLDKLSKAEAELIVFDIFMPESEVHDLMLAKAVKNAGNVLLPLVFSFDTSQTSRQNEHITYAAVQQITNSEKFGKYAPIHASGVLAPVLVLMQESMAIGHINMKPDDNDGTLRWEMMAIEYNGYLYPSLDALTAAVYLGIPFEKVAVDATRGIQLSQKRFIPTDEHGRSLIYYYGRSFTFKHYSISDIIEGEVGAKQLAGKIVLVGATAMGIYDLRVTPFSPAMPGVEKHANVISSILEKRFLRKAPLHTNIIILVLSGLFISFFVSRFKASVSLLFTFCVVVLLTAASYYLFAFKGIWIYVAYPSIAILLIFANGSAYSHAVEETYARKMKAMFSSYVTERVVNELIRNPGMAKLGGERKNVTILFSDVRGFTSFSESHSPEEVVPILNEYLGAMTEIIFKWEGTVDKFMGDAILAFWGAPMKQDNHPELAIKCSLHMLSKLRELQEKWKAEGKPALDAGIGINTGDVIVGNIGAEGRKMDYTVIGDHVNLASRVEALTRKYNASILITEFTMHEISKAIEAGRIGHIEATGLEKVIVKGKENAVGIFELKILDHNSKTVVTEFKDGNVVRFKEK
ncbi:MAG TPA: adenylate/guanylate cyclase domain-containing protein [Thermodesulfovibrionales bacterium]|nr:adenylate/guanylate cyclase domain-containing protein [Thermodesulfovibrionales bacterium]